MSLVLQHNKQQHLSELEKVVIDLVNVECPPGPASHSDCIFIEVFLQQSGSAALIPLSILTYPPYSRAN